MKNKAIIKAGLFLTTLFFTSCVVPQNVGLGDVINKAEVEAVSTEPTPIAGVTLVLGTYYSKEEVSIEKLEETYVTACEQVEEVEEATSRSYTDEELDMLSHLIMGESGGESDTCQLYVGSVVLNRVNHEKFPNTIKEVIFQKGQYACTWDGNYDKEPTEKCIENARYLLENGSVLPENVIFQANFKQGTGVYEYLEGLYFCY